MITEIWNEICSDIVNLSVYFLLLLLAFLVIFLVNKIKIIIFSEYKPNVVEIIIVISEIGIMHQFCIHPEID